MRALLGLAAVLACVGLNSLSRRVRPAGWPLLHGISADSAVETSTLLALGMRRLSADLGLVRLLIYYGTPEPGPEAEAEAGRHHEHGPWGSGKYGELGPRALRILDADPEFSYVALYAAGSLAFNLDRPDEAVRVLEYALSRDPRNPRYPAYLAAIGLHRKGDLAGVIRILEPILDTPDCPVMIKHMVAYMYAQAGQRAKALSLYRVVRDTSKDPGYRQMAQKALVRMGAP
jgi:tetratricopeptide (TPR) repeat protein